MNVVDYPEALRLLDQAVTLLQARDFATQQELVYKLRRLQRAFDIFRVQIGQAVPALQRN